MHFAVEVRAGKVSEAPRRLQVTLNLPGRHNVQNALAAITVGIELGAPYPAIIKALEQFHGVARRFQRYGQLLLPQGGSFTLVDDYGHHPVEMAATLEAARGAFPGRKLVLAFQPHRFTRTRDCFQEFAQVLSKADALVLTDIYPAGEAPIAGVDSDSLASAIQLSGQVLRNHQITQLPDELLAMLRDGDVLITMGAGSIGAVPAQLVNRTGTVQD